MVAGMFFVVARSVVAKIFYMVARSVFYFLMFKLATRVLLGYFKVFFIKCSSGY